MSRSQKLQKRLFDLALAVLLIPVIVPALLLVLLAVALLQGRPWFYAGERMKTPETAFRMWKFRTMAADPGDHGITAPHKSARVTPLGRVLRRCRADELPQIWNILRGDMSFVGPRPPLREVVERFPDLYAQVLRIPPGVTGLATLRYARREAQILAGCTDAQSAQVIYDRRCVPAKARLDLFYQRHTSPGLDLVLIWQTLLGRLA